MVIVFNYQSGRLISDRARNAATDVSRAGAADRRTPTAAALECGGILIDSNARFVHDDVRN